MLAAAALLVLLGAAPRRSRAQRPRAGERFAVVDETDDEVLSLLEAFALEQNLSATSFTAIGAFERAVHALVGHASKGLLREFRRPLGQRVLGCR